MFNLVPHFILNQYAAGERNGRFPATALFVDISGFSAITDALMQHGQHGAEVLATVMNSVFDPLVQSVYEQGGFVTGFAGDAFTAVFPHSPLQALAAAWTIQERMQANANHDTLYGRFTMTAKVGAAAGEVAWGIVTAEDGQRAGYYFLGTAIDGCAAAEKTAAAGDVFLNAALYEQVRDRVTVEVADDYYQVTAVTAALPTPQRVNLPAPDPDVASRFFPVTVTDSSSGGEFRRMVTLFISLPTVRTEAQLSIFMQTVFALQERYGGLLTRLDFGDKGANLLLFWGAPTSYENDVQRALLFILDLQTQTAIPINGGVTYRIAHAGHIGSTLRGEFTGYGSGVNLAARFMTHAPRGEIWLDENAAHRAEAEFDLDYEGEKRFKGFAQPQKVYVLFERKESEERLYSTRFIGRKAELAQLFAFAEPIFDGRFAGLFIVRGEPGIGKSRLIHDFLAQLQPPPSSPAANFALFLAQTDEILRRSLNPFRYWLQRYFSVSDALAESRNKRSFNRKLDDLIARTADSELAGELDRTRSCLGALVELRWPDSLYEQLDGKSRHENTLSALVTLLQTESHQQPLFFLWEDTHWSDEDSSSFFPRLLKGLADYPVAILTTTRLVGVDLPLEGFTFQEIELAGLTNSALAGLAQSHLGGPAAGELLDLLAERAEGNPFFAEQILHYLRDEDLLIETASGWQLKSSERLLLPADVQAVLIARLDRLARELRDVVQTAAVLGREFEIRLLTRMLQDDDNLAAKVSQAEHEAIWAALSEIRYIFRHALLRDAAYQMQLRAHRLALHALALHSLESLYAANPEAHYGEMAYHALAAHLNEPAFRYSIAAGDAAMGIFAMPDAIAHYENARQILRDKKAGEVDTGAVQHLYLQSGRALELLNRFEQAVQHYREMASMADEQSDQKLKLASLVAEGTITALPYDAQDLDRARMVSGEALALATQLGDETAEAQTLWNYLLIERVSSVDTALTIGYGERAAELARKNQERDLLATILNDLASVYAAAGELDAAETTLLEAEKILQQLNDPSVLGNTYNFLGMMTRDRGQYNRSVVYLNRGKVVTEPLGGIRNFPFMALNLGVTLSLQGNFAAAQTELNNLLALEETFSSHFLLLTTYQQMALISLNLGAHEQGIRWCKKAIAINDKVPLFARPPTFAILARLRLRQGELTPARAALADSETAYDPQFTMPGSWSFRAVPQAQVEVRLALGEIDEAETAANEMMAILQKLKYQGHMVEAWLMRAVVDLARNRTAAAYTALQKGRELAAAIGERLVSWRVLWELSRLETAAGKHDEAERYRRQAQEIVTYIADHAGSAELRASFMALPDVQRLISEIM